MVDRTIPPGNTVSADLTFLLIPFIYAPRALRCALLGAELLRYHLPSASTVDTRFVVCLSASYRLHVTGIAALSPYSFRPLSDVERGYRYTALSPYK